jgi:hypothetical protein
VTEPTSMLASAARITADFARDRCRMVGNGEVLIFDGEDEYRLVEQRWHLRRRSPGRRSSASPLPFTRREHRPGFGNFATAAGSLAVGERPEVRGGVDIARLTEVAALDLEGSGFTQDRGRLAVGRGGEEAG